MSDKRERLSVAAQHSIDFTKSIWGGAVPDFTAEDVAGAMGMGHLTQLQAEILLVGYCGHPRRSLWALTMLELERWRPQWIGAGVAQHIARAALNVVVPPEKQPGQHVSVDKCRDCRGTGKDPRDPLQNACPSCGGSGNAPLPVFQHPWDARLDELIGHLQRLESQAISRLKFGG